MNAAGHDIFSRQVRGAGAAIFAALARAWPAYTFAFARAETDHA